jgi:Flp pilus assembly protein TadD
MATLVGPKAVQAWFGVLAQQAGETLGPIQPGSCFRAICLLDRAHRVAPNGPEVYLVRGQVRARANDTAGAIAVPRPSASLSPKSPYPLQLLAILYRQVGQAKPADAAVTQAGALER